MVKSARAGRSAHTRGARTGVFASAAAMIAGALLVLLAAGETVSPAATVRFLGIAAFVGGCAGLLAAALWGVSARSLVARVAVLSMLVGAGALVVGSVLSFAGGADRAMVEALIGLGAGAMILGGVIRLGTARPSQEIAAARRAGHGRFRQRRLGRRAR